MLAVRDTFVLLLARVPDLGGGGGGGGLSPDARETEKVGLKE